MGRLTLEEESFWRRHEGSGEMGQGGAQFAAAGGVVDRGATLLPPIFCEVLRLGAKSAPLSFRPREEGWECDVTFMERKCFTAPVVVSRSCICKSQGRLLCGQCALRSISVSEHILRGDSICSSPVFSSVTYTSALASLKLGAAALGFPNPASWATHCFRRGFAEDALRAGGPGTRFWAGGWRGVATLGYTEARTRGKLGAAEWLIDHADSSDPD